MFEVLVNQVWLSLIQAVETALTLWVAKQNSVSQRYDAKGLAQFWGPDV